MRASLSTQTPPTHRTRRRILSTPAMLSTPATFRRARPSSPHPFLFLALALALAAAPAAAHAQSLFPDVRPFPPLLADPHEVRLAAGLAWTDLFDPDNPTPERPPFSFRDPDDVRRDLQGMVSLGGTLPLWGSDEDDDTSAVYRLAVQAGVFARFRIEEPSRDYAASDWTVALPFEWAKGPLETRARILHRSSHLGDELIFQTDARRIEYGHEAIDFVVGYRVVPSTRLYGGGAWIFRSNTEGEPLLLLRGLDIEDRLALQVGFDGEWALRDDGRLNAVAGVDWQAAQRTGWDSQISAVLGLATRGPGGGLKLVLRYFNGPSALGQFFLTKESYWAIEAIAIP